MTATAKRAGKKPASGGRAAGKRRQYMAAAERRQHILDSAREVFARQGLKGARTRELAQAAGINPATLFEHFRSKEELFVAAVVQPLEQLMEGARERAESYAAADTPEDMLSLLQPGMAMHLQSMVENYPLLVQALFSEPSLGEIFYRAHMEPMFQARASLMKEFVKPGTDSELVQLASFGMMFAVAMDCAMTGRQRDLNEVAQQLSELILHGTSTHSKGEQRD